MIEIQINNLFVVQNQIERLGRGLDDNRYLLMRRLSGTMHAAVMTNFRQGGRPKWLGLKYRNGKPLVDTGALRGSITELADNDTALVGTNLVYAAIHNFGGMAGRGKKVRIPQREFLTLTGQDKQDLMDDVQDYFAGLIG
ncbi:phage virion morphogenesis protein [Bergeriella denitrificans]|uniref:Putative phage tail completion protein n=1 Tax=Bergeriella denitrificans TaxID=494 RepID=A0A378UEE9_BERDE|nr:phage virion morphogenesis protein [Bergeriella denitrificans]STZ75560.1 putative phage tail completion protein [Bergeriella denitrificans]